MIFDDEVESDVGTAMTIETHTHLIYTEERDMICHPRNDGVNPIVQTKLAVMVWPTLMRQQPTSVIQPNMQPCIGQPDESHSWQI
jgi:hypothetical protein